MATTSIWSVKGWLGKVVIYVENPEKTTDPKSADVKEIKQSGMVMEDSGVQGLSDVIAYAVQEEKTRCRERGKSAAQNGMDMEDEIADEGEPVLQQYVSGINCTPSTARFEMLAVKKRFGKDEGIMAFHGYQSFAPGECTPAMAHEIGRKLAEELWGGRFQVLVATHLDKAHHLHNHFVVNSVSFADGLRYHRTNQDYRDMRRVSDRLCREYGLSVIEHPRKRVSKHYGEWRAEQEDRPTYRSMVREDIDEAIAKARTEKQFFHYLKEKGYSFKFGKDITVRPEGKERGLKLARNFGEEYTLESIRRRILTQETEKNNKWMTGNGTEEKSIYAGREGELKRIIFVRVQGSSKRTKKIGGLRGLYLHYCYELGILPKNRPPINTKQLHFLLREDLRKLDTISKETRLLCRYHIDTAEQLFSFKETLEEQMQDLSDTRKHLRYQIRSIKDEDKRTEVKAEISKLTKELGELRREVVLCDGIAARSGVIKEKLKAVRQETTERKEEKNHEHVRRGR